MKHGIIFAHKSTWRSRLDLEYLDETSNRKVSAQRHEDGSQDSRVRPLKQFADYASKETLGQVHAGGFLHDLIRVNADGTSTAPSKLTNDERKKRISDSWCRHLRKFPTSSENPVIQHRLVFSMSDGLHDKLVAFGINPDRVLHSTMKKAMAKFAERFHPDDAVGYAYGLHHDTDNLHVHVALCPPHCERRVCRLQYGTDSGIGPQGPDEVSALVLRKGEQTLGADSRFAAKIGGAPFQAARLRQDHICSASESFPDECVAEHANGGCNPAATI